ncbi:FAD-dependent oxidoreductase [Nocardia sp. NPDC051756]|uniref:hydroxysqualene dehydroxylase n=1 Tax=Nocardia sp. NPDC051756 TaxID=3154751 RepID=UPI00341271D4
MSESRRRVAIFGGGTAGMTAAHELAERGFDVDLYERHQMLGGKARSFGYPGTGTDGRPDLPGSTGGHFFMGDMPNLGDTLHRIPISGGGTVLDRLSTAPIAGRLAWGAAAPYVTAPTLTTTRRWRYPVAVLRMGRELLDLRLVLTKTDLTVLGRKFAALITSGEQRQWGQLEHQTIEDYFGVDRLSAEARKLAQLPCYAWLANDAGASARSVAQTFAVAASGVFGRRKDGLPHIASMLDGPETTVWFDAWARHLNGLGVRIHLGHTVTGFSLRDGVIATATAQDGSGSPMTVDADWYVLAVPSDKAATLIDEDLLGADPALAAIADTPLLHGLNLQIYLRHRVTELGVLFMSFDSPWEMGNEVLSNHWTLNLSDYGDGTVRECVSVQLSDATWWSRPGMLYGKPAKDCTGEEIIAEVLAQMRYYLPGGEQIFAASAIHSIRLGPATPVRADGGLTIDEPLVSASPSASNLRPSARTQIGNFFLAGAYTRNFAAGDQLAGANESGRRAAAEVLAASGIHAPPVEIETWTPPAWLRALWNDDDRRYKRGLPNRFDVVPTRPGRSTSAPAR